MRARRAAILSRRSAYDPLASAWATAVTVAGGTYSTATLALVSALFAGIRTDGDLALLHCLGPMAGDQLAAGRVQYRGGVFEQAAITNFVNGDYTEATGVTGNIAGTKSWDTNVPQNTFTQADRHLGIYLRGLTSTINTDYIGSETASNTQVNALGALAAVDTMNFPANATNGNGGNSIAGTSAGHFVGVQTVATDSVMYRNGVSVDTGTALTAATPGTQTITLFARKRGASTLVRHSDGIISGYHIGYGLTAAQAARIYSRLQTFNAALGRQV